MAGFTGRGFCFRFCDVGMRRELPFAPSEPIVVDNPQFVGWGGLGSAGENNTFDMDTTETDNCRITYTFPAETAGYTNISMEYTLTIKEGETLPMKIGIKSSLKNKWDYDPADEVKYIESATTANMTFDEKVSSFPNGCLTIEHNTYNDESSSFNITITKITFTKD